MKKHIAITILCLALVSFNTACESSGDPGYYEELPKDYTYDTDLSECDDYVEDPLVCLQNDEDTNSLDVTLKYSVSGVEISTNTDIYKIDLGVAGYTWTFENVQIKDITAITFEKSLQCNEAKYKKVGQVSYKFSAPGTYVFCSENEVLEVCTLEKKGIYNMQSFSDVHKIYEVREDE